MKTVNLSLRRVGIALTVLTTAMSAAHAADNPSDANVHMSAVSNAGSATVTKYICYFETNSDGIEDTYYYPDFFGVSADRTPPSDSKSGTTYFELENNTPGTLTFQATPAITIKAYGSTQRPLATAQSSISLSSTTSSGSCSGNNGSNTYSHPQTVTFADITSLTPGRSASASGSFSCTVYGGGN